MPIADLHEIAINPSTINQYFDFDVYFRTNDGRLALYKKKGTHFNADRVKFGKLPGSLHVSLSDKINQVRDQTRLLNEKLVSELKTNPRKAKQRLSEVVAITLSIPRGEVLEGVKDTIDVVVSEYLNSPHVLKNLSQVSIKDYSTQLHLTNAMVLCLGYAHHAGYSEDEMKLFGLIGLLHDVGKVHIPDEVLTAARKLTDEEFELIKGHSLKGWEMLKECEFDETVPLCALEHHERIDGSGYPEGKEGKDLGDYSRTLAIIDVYEALTNWRPYKEPMPPLQAFKIIKSEADQGKLDKTIFKDFAYTIAGMMKN